MNKNSLGTTATVPPNQDNYNYDGGGNPNDFSTINRFERNGLGEANARPDTEDLNRNTIADFNNNYFEASIDLADTQYVAIDVPVLYAGYTNVKGDNGWGLFRVPITGGTFRSVGSPSWQNIQHLRLWVSGFERPIKIQVGGIEFAGSRGLEGAILDPGMVFLTCSSTSAPAQPGRRRHPRRPTQCRTRSDRRPTTMSSRWRYTRLLETPSSPSRPR